MELYAEVRRSVYVEGLSERAAARRFGLARETVRKMLRYRVPPGYRRQQPIRCPKLDAFTGVIDQILHDDQPRRGACVPTCGRHSRRRPCGSSWKTRSVFQGAVGAFCASTVPSASTGPVRVRQDDSQGGGGPPRPRTAVDR